MFLGNKASNQQVSQWNSTIIIIMVNGAVNSSKRNVNDWNSNLGILGSIEGVGRGECKSSESLYMVHNQKNIQFLC